jgi:hypothetical protein
VRVFPAFPTPLIQRKKLLKKMKRAKAAMESGEAVPEVRRRKGRAVQFRGLPSFDRRHSHAK